MSPRHWAARTGISLMFLNLSLTADFSPDLWHQNFSASQHGPGRAVSLPHQRGLVPAALTHQLACHQGTHPGQRVGTPQHLSHLWPGRVLVPQDFHEAIYFWRQTSSLTQMPDITNFFPLKPFKGNKNCREKWKWNQGTIEIRLLAFPKMCLLDLRNTDFMTLHQVVKIEIPAARVSERTLPPQYLLWKQQTNQENVTTLLRVSQPCTNSRAIEREIGGEQKRWIVKISFFIEPKLSDYLLTKAIFFDSVCQVFYYYYWVFLHLCS